MDQISCMQAFAAVAREGSFSKAGKRLGLSKVMISKNVGRLEDRLGVRLLNRTTRKVSLTTTGEAYLARCVPLLEEFDHLNNSVQDIHQTPRGILRVSAPTTFSEMHLLPVLENYRAKYPDVSLELHFHDRFVDLVDEGFDLAVRIGNMGDSSLISRSILQMGELLCASPAYLEKYGTPMHPTDLPDHAVIVDSNYPNGPNWLFKHGETGEIITMQVAPGVTTNNCRIIRDLLVNGHGISLCPEFAVEQDIASGELLSLLPEWLNDSFSLSVVYPHKRHLSNKIRLFIEEMKQHFLDG